jgi:MurNAc alpha-1-phosphate uridylyltransferase
MPLLGDAPFVAVNADLHTDFPFARLRTALGADALAHLVLVDNPPHHPGGDFALADGRIANTGARLLTFSGIGVYRPALFAAIAPGTRAPLAPLLRDAATRGRATGEHFRGRWLDIGTPERLAALDAELRAAGA